MNRNCGEVFFSFVSPYAWKAALFLERYRNVRWTPFWVPVRQEIRQRLEARGHDVAVSPMPFRKVLYALGDLRRRAAARGEAMALPRDRHADWDLPHLAFLEAKRNAKDREFLMSAYRARWVNGDDITSTDGLARVFESVGLDSQVLTSLAGDHDVCEEAAEGLSRACRSGVFGVPFFVGGRESYWGIDRMSDFIRELDEQTEREDGSAGVEESRSAGTHIPDPPPEVVDTIGMYDFDHPGGCG
jgi:2-hydroxychromene-2-carboxylate isomerase